MRVKEESEKAGLKLNIKKILRPWHPAPSSTIISWQIEGEKIVTDFLSWALKSLWMVTAAMKSEDDCFLAGKL